MIKVTLRQEAINDLDEIYLYTFYKWSENQADIYYNALRESCNEIGRNPKVGRKYFKMGKDILGLKSGKHIIL